MNPTKVTLSSKERIMVMDTDWILTKNAIIQKVCDLFGELCVTYEFLLQNQTPDTFPVFICHSPKISKGEKYKGLPWVMLDYPRHYTKTDSFGIRSFFWWGNFCSISIQLSGSFQQHFMKAIQLFFEQKKSDTTYQNNWFICVGEDAWEHDFEKNNYEPISEKMLKALPQLPFIKLTKKIPLQEWDQLDNFFAKSYLEIMLMLTADEFKTHLNDEIVL